MSSRTGNHKRSFPKGVSIQTILQDVHTGRMQLPRFQRKIAWKLGISAEFLKSTLRSDPIGLFLTLEVSPSKIPFKTRRIEGVPSTGNNSGCTELLLDGQQRIMSLYRSVEDGFDKSFVVEFSPKTTDKGKYEIIELHQISKSRKNSKKLRAYKLPSKKEKIDTPYFFPVWLLSPYTDGSEADKWIKKHTKEHQLPEKEIREPYNSIRSDFLDFQIPITRLPQKTSKGDAIEIFIQMNRSVAKLSAFDIAVAQMEKETKKSFHGRVKEIAKKAVVLGDSKSARKEKKIGEFILRVFCLRQEIVPTEGKFTELKIIEEIDKDWNKFKKAIELMKDLLFQEKVWDEKRLPSWVPLHVIAALFMEQTPSANIKGRYNRVLKKYLWRAFLSNRYSYAANKHMYDDYVGLLEELVRDDFNLERLKSKVPIFGNKGEPLETGDIIEKPRWPAKADRVGKAILILMLKKGAEDIITEIQPASDTIDEYEYHHIYPKEYIEDIKSPLENSVFNCMLLKNISNKFVNCKAPSEYLMEIMEKAVDIPEGERQDKLSEKTGNTPYSSSN